jgi:hypothetical protein
MELKEMETIFQIILGALLAVGGSFLAQRKQLNHNQTEMDKKIIFQIISILLDYSATSKSLNRGNEKSNEADRESKLNYELADYHHQLSSLALQITSKNFLGLAVNVTKFALHKQLRTEENLYWLTKQAQESINKELIERYEKEIGEFPSRL